MVYDCLIKILHNDSMNIECNILPSVLMCADFLCCMPVLNMCISKIRSEIQLCKNDEHIRLVFGERNKWNKTEYETICKNDSWCVKFSHVKSKFLK